MRGAVSRPLKPAIVNCPLSPVRRGSERQRRSVVPRQGRDRSRRTRATEPTPHVPVKPRRSRGRRRYSKAFSPSTRTMNSSEAPMRVAPGLSGSSASCCYCRPAACCRRQNGKRRVSNMVREPATHFRLATMACANMPLTLGTGEGKDVRDIGDRVCDSANSGDVKPSGSSVGRCILTPSYTLVVGQQGDEDNRHQNVHVNCDPCVVRRVVS